MRKELVWAGIIGISFGLVIAFGAWRITSLNKKPPAASATPTPAPIVSEFKITLDKPEENDVVTDNVITVSGITKGLTWVTVSGEKGDYIVQSDESGVFSQDIDLINGVNQIKVNAFDPAGAQSVQKVLVVYSSSFEATTVPTPTPGDSSTESAIRARVQQKVLEAMNKPKAYLGTVTDIADSTIQIKTANGEISQISTAGDQITVVSSKGTANKIVKLTDIAIGDYIVAMGYINSSSVLAAQRILITDPVSESKVDAFYGKVTDESLKSFTVTPIKGGAETAVTPGSKTDLENFAAGKLTSIKMAKIGTGDLVIYIIDSSSATPTVRAVFVVQKAQT